MRLNYQFTPVLEIAVELTKLESVEANLQFASIDPCFAQSVGRSCDGPYPLSLLDPSKADLQFWTPFVPMSLETGISRAEFRHCDSNHSIVYLA